MDEDLNRLSVFRVLMQERSVTGAARRLGLGQPAVSRTLAHLRESLDDPLFVRSGRVLEPTPRAVALNAELTPALERIEQALRASQDFDPLMTERDFKIALSDDLQLSVLPGISAMLGKCMPKTRLIVQQTDYIRAGRMLDDGKVSIAAGYLDKLPANAKIKKLARVGYRMVANSALALPRSTADYCSRAHVLVTFAGDLVGYIDEGLNDTGHERDIVMSVSTFSVLPAVLGCRDVIATVPDHAARALAEQDGLQAAELPFTTPRFDVSMTWRATTDRDPAEQLLRRIIEDEARAWLRSQPD
ncbi:MAG: LysR family transcriptional regulator [Pseudomonadota bacterium]